MYSKTSHKENTKWGGDSNPITTYLDPRSRRVGRGTTWVSTICIAKSIQVTPSRPKAVLHLRLFVTSLVHLCLFKVHQKAISMWTGQLQTNMRILLMECTPSMWRCGIFQPKYSRARNSKNVLKGHQLSPPLQLEPVWDYKSLIVSPEKKIEVWTNLPAFEILFTFIAHHKVAKDYRDTKYQSRGRDMSSLD